ncbi:hypothetical protein Pst134EA_002721 [Puccinia striiformis f. sp. tritici]|uniref:hypothetical protein n=1 Tax=Puccinia striiformis f. sp. tritici TaxID=168172 RepID=UPI002008DFD1|nr:hypothetical protein Pst134EA_002721 [Puccinia striiformis f. sp. tritici]KAH9472095.1 hypothetical protein Pst134EA_002721 [Puccinia striiformis f. sp. tritici]
MSTPSNNEERLRLQDAYSSPMVFPSSSAGHPTSDAAPQSGSRVQGIRRTAQNNINSSSPLRFPSSSNSTVRGRRSGRGAPSSEPLFFPPLVPPKDLTTGSRTDECDKKLGLRQKVRRVLHEYPTDEETYIPLCLHSHRPQ